MDPGSATIETATWPNLLGHQVLLEQRHLVRRDHLGHGVQGTNVLIVKATLTSGVVLLVQKTCKRYSNRHLRQDFILSIRSNRTQAVVTLLGVYWC